MDDMGSPGNERSGLASQRTETQSIESMAEPDVVVNLLADPRNIPIWAPEFADKVPVLADIDRQRVSTVLEKELSTLV